MAEARWPLRCRFSISSMAPLALIHLWACRDDTLSKWAKTPHEGRIRIMTSSVVSHPAASAAGNKDVSFQSMGWTVWSMIDATSS